MAASRESEAPVGSEHQPDAVRRQKQARFRQFMQQFSGKLKGSAAYRRREGHP